MVRPFCEKNIEFIPKHTEFKPDGCPKNTQIVYLSPEETEALRLKNVENLQQTQAAKKMNISQSTFQRILSSAYKKLSVALVEGKIIKLTQQHDE